MPEPVTHDPSGRPTGLSNWRVRSKLIAVLVIPAVAFLALASFGLGSSVRDARAIGQGTRLAELGRQVTALAHELQSERDQTAGYIESARQGAPPEQARQGLIDQRRRVDDAVGNYRTAEAELYDGLGERLRGRFDAVREGLDGLTGLRETVTSASLSERAAFEEFSQIVDSLLDVNVEIAQPGGDQELAQNVRVFNDFSRVKEVSSQVRGTLYAIIIRDAFAFGEFQSFADLLARQRAALDQFRADANEAQRGLYADVVRGQAVLTVARSQQAALNRQANPSLGIDREQWLAASSTQIELLRSVESRLLDDVVQQSRSLSTSTNRRLALNALLIAAILAVALLALLVVARSMARPLQRLRVGALDIAEHRLPAAVERLRTAESADLDVDVEPIGIRSREEIGQVAQAVDAIQRVAVRLATEQAALRRSIGDMFTNLARRSQTLIDRQLELIEDLERNETDPDTLEHLFRLDHLATRMRRNAEDLIVLSGADPGRHWAQPMTLVDVVRAAAAEVEEYQRVELLPLADLEVPGHTSVDVIHLLAELIENATSFSPPNTKVQIAGQELPHGYVIEIEDRGLGMSDDELIQANERLANPPEIDFALSRMLGLYVVGRLAQRYGIRVQLRHSWYGGVTALTLMPNSLLVWPNMPQAMPQPADGHARAELPPPQRPAADRPVADGRVADGRAAERPAAEEPAAEQPNAADGTEDARDHLPIFEAARSDWFTADPVEPLRPARHPGAGHQDPDGGAATAERPAQPAAAGEAPSWAPPAQPAEHQPLPVRPAPAARAADPPPPTPAPEPVQAAPPPPDPELPSAQEPFQAPSPPRPAWRPEPADAAVAAAAPAAEQPTRAERMTQAGLPRRVPRANLAPGMTAAPAAGPAQPKQARSPDEVRSMLSSYRTGIERGRMVAGGPEGQLPDESS